VEGAAVKGKEPVKGTYQHYKGGLYEMLGIADDPAGGKEFVVYQSLGITEDLLGDHPVRILRTGNKGALSVCSIERFTESVDGGEFTGGKRVPRFKLISEAPCR
jgi:hypothetical protein